MYIATISTITDIMMSVTISRSSRKPGIGVISAITMASTASGTANSLQRFSENDRRSCPPVRCFARPLSCHRPVPVRFISLKM